jgi:hypothetical protein
VTLATAMRAPRPRWAASLAARMCERVGVARSVGTAVRWRNSAAAPRAMKREGKSRPVLRLWRAPAVVSRLAVVSVSERLVLGAVKAGIAVR